jgi:hypothetical protein
MVIVNPATDGNKDAESTVLQCSVKTNDYSKSMQSLAVGMTSLLGPESHGTITLIVTENNNNQYVGASAVDKKYYQCDNFINLDYSSDTTMVASGSLAQTSTMSSDISTTSPTYTTAYTITMSMSAYADPYDFDGHYPNPIETIGGLLATEKSTGKLFQIASFTCKSTDGYTPSSATAVVVIDKNNVDSFTKKFNKSYESIKNKFDKLEDHFVYTMTETSVPSSVISNEDSDNIISLMYTLNTGIYLQDESSGEILSASDTSYVSTNDGKFKVVVKGRALAESDLTDMSNAYLTTSGLCDISYSSTDPTITWTYDKDKSLGSYFASALSVDDIDSATTMLSTECDIFSAKNPGLNIISFRFAMDNGDSAMLNIIHFLSSLTGEE